MVLYIQMASLKLILLLALLGAASAQDYYSTKLAQRLVQLSAISYES
jgi:hypothetical protein